jgi:hypothetical protein
VEGQRVMTGNHALNFCHVFFGRIGTWFLIGPSLMEFCCNRNIVIDGCISVGLYNVNKQEVVARLEAFNVTLKHEAVASLVVGCYDIEFHIFLFSDFRKGAIACGAVSFPKAWLQCDAALCAEVRQKNPLMSLGMWRIPLNEKETIEFRLPFKAGSVLDAWMPGWWTTIKHDPSVWRFHDVFFDLPRKLNGVELIKQMYDCGRKAGIDHAMFIGYGTALGAVRHGDFIPSDRDMDMCIVADWISVEQALEYVRLCREAGLGEHRWVTPQCRSDTGMPLWFSLGPKNPVSQSGVKSCNWFWFSHGGYWWHSKGGMWVSPTKFSKKKTQYNAGDAAIAKGAPLECLNSLVTMDFLGAQVRVPDRLGCCLDHWYPCWPAPREGASAHEWVMVVEKWEDKNSWRIG